MLAIDIRGVPRRGDYDAPPWSACKMLASLKGVHMIFLGVALLVLGFFASIPILWPFGIILLAIGIVFELRGMAGHAVRGRRHYY